MGRWGNVLQSIDDWLWQGLVFWRYKKVNLELRDNTDNSAKPEFPESLAKQMPKNESRLVACAVDVHFLQEKSSLFTASFFVTAAATQLTTRHRSFFKHDHIFESFMAVCTF